MTIYFGFEKGQVIQALRYHFISRREIRLMIILVNVFAALAIILFLTKTVQPMAFLMSSFLWVVLMISFWYILPHAVYRRNITFRHEFSMDFTENQFALRHEKGYREWPWTALHSYLESPHFFHLYFDRRSFLLVPKSGCESLDQIAELRSLIKNRVKKG